MQSTDELMVTGTRLVEDNSIDSGLVLVTARVVRDGPIHEVKFLSNISDGWWVSRTVKVTVEWEPSEVELEHHDDNDGEYVLERSFFADDLDPSDFTPDSVDAAGFVEGEEG